MSQATVTAAVGPGLTATAIVITDIVDIDFDLPGEVLSLTLTNGQVRTFALTGSNTITLTASGGTYTLTIA
jgi:hypothetical protein